MTRVSTLSANNQLIKYMQRGQVLMQEKQVQLATEKKSTDYTGIAKNSERLINSENTRNVILDPRANELGFAWYQERNGKIWWTMILGGNSLSTVQ